MNATGNDTGPGTRTAAVLTDAGWVALQMTLDETTHDAFVHVAAAQRQRGIDPATHRRYALAIARLFRVPRWIVGEGETPRRSAMHAAYRAKTRRRR